MDANGISKGSCLFNSPSPFLVLSLGDGKVPRVVSAALKEE